MTGWEACMWKRGYATEAEAQEKGKDVYFCLWCGKFHRAAKLTDKAKQRGHHGKFLAYARMRAKKGATA